MYYYYSKKEFKKERKRMISYIIILLYHININIYDITIFYKNYRYNQNHINDLII